jgi:hypothetical protein
VATYFMVAKWHRNQVALTRQQAERECLEVIKELEEELNATTDRLEAEQQTQPRAEGFPTVFGTTTPGRVNDALPADCQQIASQMRSLFNYLDNRAYVSDRNMAGGSSGFFQESSALLVSNPPVNIAEMQDMYRLVKNVTHFYRVLGSSRLGLAKEMLATESDIIEPAMAVFYAHIVECGMPLPGDKTPISLEQLYDYAGFFLNTLGGRSYLLRRDSKLRMLINYYAILIIDRANDRKSNQYGIDIRPYIDYLFYDISNQKGLAFRERYLTQLTALRDKYM